MRSLRQQVAQPLDQSYRFIPLTQNQIAIVDAEDFERISQYLWYASWNVNTKSFYAARKTLKRDGPRKIIMLHSFIMDPPEGMEVDHEDWNTLDDRIDNLRICTPGQNKAHRRSAGESGYRGVYRDKSCNRWKVAIGRERKYLGLYESPEEGALAYDREAIRLYGKFAVLNFPNQV
jgi:hypothetical protein